MRAEFAQYAPVALLVPRFDEGDIFFDSAPSGVGIARIIPVLKAGKISFKDLCRQHRAHAQRVDRAGGAVHPVIEIVDQRDPAQKTFAGAQQAQGIDALRGELVLHGQRRFVKAVRQILEHPLEEGAAYVRVYVDEPRQYGHLRRVDHFVVGSFNFRSLLGDESNVLPFDADVPIAQQCILGIHGDDRSAMDQCSSHNGIPPLYIIIIHRKQKIKRTICIMDKMRQINI